MAGAIEALGLHLREGSPADIERIVELVNLAYRVEDFFIDGDRTHPGEVQDYLEQGTFLVLGNGEGTIVASVFTRIEGECGYFGMLSVHPSLAKHGLGRALIAEAEQRARDAGCSRMRLVVVNLRTELIPWYEQLGYVESQRVPFAEPQKLKRPAEFVEMVRDLSGA